MTRENQGKILVVLGAPGSGKGTLSKELNCEMYTTTRMDLLALLLPTRVFIL